MIDNKLSGETLPFILKRTC